MADREYKVNLSTEIPNNFFTQSACNSVDLKIDEPFKHKLSVKIDLESDWNILLISGPSGSGKSSLAKVMFGEKCLDNVLDLSKPLISQFPESMNYSERVDFLTASGLSSVPQWVAPAGILSNGQKHRAEIALKFAMAKEGEVIVVDEFSSTVDRNIAMILAHAVQKFIRSKKGKLCVVACHNDLIEFLNPDMVINCEDTSVNDRRLLSQTERERKKNSTFMLENANDQHGKILASITI